MWTLTPAGYRPTFHSAGRAPQQQLPPYPYRSTPSAPRQYDWRAGQGRTGRHRTPDRHPGAGPSPDKADSQPNTAGEPRVQRCATACRRSGFLRRVPPGAGGPSNWLAYKEKIPIAAGQFDSVFNGMSSELQNPQSSPCTWSRTRHASPRPTQVINLGTLGRYDPPLRAGRGLFQSTKCAGR